MALVSQRLANLINGVSQQPALLRLSSQAEAQGNCLSSAVDGLHRRPPTVHIGKIASGDFTTARFHMIDRDVDEKYGAILINGDLKVFDVLTGQEKTVNFPDGKGYLTVTNPQTSFRAVTAADYTYVVNREIQCGMTSDKSPVRPPEAMVFFQVADYMETFTITLNNQSWTLKTPAVKSDDSSRWCLMTDTIASTLAGTMTSGSVGSMNTDGANNNYYCTAPGAASGFTITAVGSLLHITRADGVDFTIGVSDGNGGTHIKAFKGVAQRFTDLPQTGIDGFVLKVIGDPENDATDYWVQYQANIDAPSTSTQPSGGNTGSTDGSDGTYPGVNTPSAGYIAALEASQRAYQY